MKNVTNFTCDFLKDAKAYLSNSELKEDITIRITKNDLKEKLNRQRIKEPLLKEVEKKLNEAGCMVEKCDNDLCVTVPVKLAEKQILTLKELTKKGN